jgi:hypothetical protein
VGRPLHGAAANEPAKVTRAVGISALALGNGGTFGAICCGTEQGHLKAGWAHVFIACVGTEEAGMLVLDMVDRIPQASIR